jgi:ABC-type multidrug transport system ATPase subunit
MLHVDGAACAVGGRSIFRSVSFQVQAGEKLHLAGINGSGKTSLLRCIGGTMAFSSGSATIGSHPAGSVAARALTGLCVEPEKGLYLNMSGYQNLAFAARIRCGAGNVGKQVDGVVHEMGIGGFAADRVTHYSAGMRARVAIARALIGRPALLLLDEPTRSLDDDGRELFWAALAARPAAAVVIASHLALDRERCHTTLDLAGPS